MDCRSSNEGGIDAGNAFELIFRNIEIFLNYIPKLKSAEKVNIDLVRPLLIVLPPNQSTESSGPPH